MGDAEQLTPKSAVPRSTDPASIDVGVSRRDPATGPTAWARLLVMLLARAYRTILLTLSLVAVAPLVLSWSAYVIESDSMRPSIAVGDVVVARPTSVYEPVRVGRVYVFDDPAQRGRLLVHRIVERRDDGDFTTAGDANDLTDTTPLRSRGIQGRAMLLVPYVGLPVHWLRTEQWVKLALWLLLTAAALVLATENFSGSDKPRRQRWRRKHIEEGTPPRPRELAPHVAAAIAAVVAVTAIGAIGAGTAGAAFTDRTTNGSNQWRVGSWTQPYIDAVQADQPYGFWLLDEPAGSPYGADRSGNDRTAQYYNPLTLGQPGGLPNNPGTAVKTAGGRVILGPNAVSAPKAYSIELWFRTTARSRGYLAGFENDRDGSSRNSTADRLMTMESNGRLRFGVWGYENESLTTSRAYNDGVWHHLVVTSDARKQTTIYVDGASVAEDMTSFVANYRGYWRVGQGTTGGPNGATSAFNGEIDNVSIFHEVLTRARVAAHWAAR